MISTSAILKPSSDHGRVNSDDNCMGTETILRSGTVISGNAATGTAAAPGAAAVTAITTAGGGRGGS